MQLWIWSCNGNVGWFHPRPSRKQCHCTHPGCLFAWLATTPASHVATWMSLPENTGVFYLRKSCQTLKWTCIGVVGARTCARSQAVEWSTWKRQDKAVESSNANSLTCWPPIQQNSNEWLNLATSTQQRIFWASQVRSKDLLSRMETQTVLVAYMPNLKSQMILRKPQTVLVCPLVQLRQLWLLHTRCFKNQSVLLVSYMQSRSQAPLHLPAFTLAGVSTMRSEAGRFLVVLICNPQMPCRSASTASICSSLVNLKIFSATTVMLAPWSSAETFPTNRCTLWSAMLKLCLFQLAERFNRKRFGIFCCHRDDLGVLHHEHFTISSARLLDGWLVILGANEHTDVPRKNERISQFQAKAWKEQIFAKENMQEWVNEYMDCCLMMQLVDDANSECCTTRSNQAADDVLSPDSLVSRAAVADATHLQLATCLHDANSECCTFRSAQQALLHTDPFTHKPFWPQTILHTEAFTHRRFYTQTLLHTDAFTHKHFHTQKLLHTDAFTQKRFYTQMLLHTDAFTHITLYSQTLLHADASTHRNVYTETLLHTHAFTRRPVYTQTVLHADAFTHRSFYTQRLLPSFTYRRFYTQQLLHIDAFTHRSFYTQKRLHTDAFTHRDFYTQTFLHTDTFTHKYFRT